MRTLLVVVVGIAAILASAVGSMAGAAPTSAREAGSPHPEVASADTGDGTSGKVDIVQITGILDTAMLEHALAAVNDAPDRDTAFLVFQIDTPGAIVDIAPLLAAMEQSPVPIGAWVGPAGASVGGAGAELVIAADIAAISSGTSIGPLLPLRLDGKSTADRQDPRTARQSDLAEAILNRSLGAGTVLENKFIPISAPTVAEFLARANGKTVSTSDGESKLAVTQLVDEKGKPTVAPADLVRFRGLTLERRIRHTLTVPGVVLLLLLFGLCLIVFEFFTAGVGLAGVAGAIGLVGAGIGLAELPVRWWALAMIVVGILGFSVDVQAMITKAWSTVGAVLVAIGSWFLFGGADSLRPDWWIVVVLVIGVIAFMLNGMSSMVRARFSTPTIGRTALIGEVGSAETAIDPDGVVVIRGAHWRARTNRATPIAAGAAMRVAEIDGLILEVEPLEGAARDHRDRRPSSTDPAPE